LAFLIFTIDVWQGLAMESLKFHPGQPCPTFLRPAGGLPLKRPYGPFWGGPAAGRVACGRILPFWTPQAVRLCPPYPLAFLIGLPSSSSGQDLFAALETGAVFGDDAKCRRRVPRSGRPC
jgi:hypothetical protein